MRPLIVLAALALALPGAAVADCAMDAGAGLSLTGPYLFPNWNHVHVASFTITECDDTTCSWCPTGGLTGLTLANLGTATSADINGVYYRITCGGKFDTGYIPMTYAGVCNFSWGSSPAWTWAGAPAIGWTDACANCGCNLNLDIYLDIAACPVDGRSVRMGLGFNDIVNPAWPGGVSDACGCAAPWAQTAAPSDRFIKYTAKEGDQAIIAPGDTVTYTVYYGLPGTSPLTGITVLDTLPAFTHYLPGTGSPAPDPGWDPDWGPPIRLRWSLPGGAPGTGPTAAVTFSVSADWGNGEGFEPGSGDTAAPEGARLVNLAHATFAGTSCPQSGFVSNQTQTVVRRFLFWKTADNDILFTTAYGQPNDEITYSIFVKNTSATKTWWNVSVWDTVPAQVDPWGPGYGFDDPCLGWTMTPGGCAAAGPGTVVAGPATILTWRLDMPPQMTLTLRWKASVRPTVVDGSTAVNVAAVMEYGRTSIIGGTGHSGVPRIFTHTARIVLPTTYISYIGIAASDANFWGCCTGAPFATQTYWISFFPLNKKTDFNLYEQVHAGDAFASNGGASPSINGYVGGCLTGGAAWIPGCKIERAPAHYLPTAYAGCPGPTNFHNLYKLVSNSPLLWELLTADLKNDADASTYVGATSLSYAGYTLYTYSRVCSFPQETDALYLTNTSATTGTTCHVFRWNGLSLGWDYVETSDLNTESIWLFNPDTAESYKVISGDAPLIVFKGYPGIGMGGAFNDSGSESPNKENGYLVSTTTPATFYAYCGGPANDNASLAVGNSGAVDAKYEIWEYFSDFPTMVNPTTAHLTTNLLGNSGSWTLLAVDTVPAGLANPGNPHVYGAGYQSLITDTYSCYKIKCLTAGAQIQVYNGRDIYSGYGCGSVMHSRTPPIGTEYWFHEAEAGNDCGGNAHDIMTFDFYCPKTGTAVTLVSGDGASASYVTPGQDSCVSFKALTTPAAPGTRVWKATSVGGTIAVAHQIHCQLSEKIYTAPFLNQGVHYVLIAPPVVFAGQSFWLTVLVVNTGGDTQTDYCGTSSFTSTEPAATMAGLGMDGFNYTWDSNAASASCKGVCCSGAADNGVAIFVNVVMNKLGLQTIVASDTTDGSISGLTTIMVVGADVHIDKVPKLTVGASGDTVGFRVCWSNYSSASAFTFVITDAVPEGSSFLPEASTASFDCGNTDGLPPVVGYSTTASATPPPAGAAWTNGNPVLGTRWLRWTLPMAGVGTTGCVCYRVTVN